MNLMEKLQAQIAATLGYGKEDKTNYEVFFDGMTVKVSSLESYVSVTFAMNSRRRFKTFLATVEFYVSKRYNTMRIRMNNNTMLPELADMIAYHYPELKLREVGSCFEIKESAITEENLKAIVNLTIGIDENEEA